MTWARFDDACAWHEKTLRAGNAAFGAWCRMVMHSCAQLSDGFIGETTALAIATESSFIAKLVEVGLLDVVAAEDGGGYRVHDFLDFNPSARDVRKSREATRKQRSIAGKASAERRSAASTKRQREPNGAVERSLNEPSTEPQRAAGAAVNEASTPSRPVPSRPDLVSEDGDEGERRPPAPPSPAGQTETPPAELSPHANWVFADLMDDRDLFPGVDGAAFAIIAAKFTERVEGQSRNQAHASAYTREALACMRHFVGKYPASTLDQRLHELKTKMQFALTRDGNNRFVAGKALAAELGFAEAS